MVIRPAGVRKTGTRRPTRQGVRRPWGTAAQKAAQKKAAVASAAKRRGKTKSGSVAGYKGTGNARFKRIARASGNKQMRLAAGALHKSRSQRTAAEQRAVERTRAYRGSLKKASTRTRQQKRAIARVKRWNAMDDAVRTRKGRKAMPRQVGYTKFEDLSIKRRKPGQLRRSRARRR